MLDSQWADLVFDAIRTLEKVYDKLLALEDRLGKLTEAVQQVYEQGIAPNTLLKIFSHLDRLEAMLRSMAEDLRAHGVVVRDRSGKDGSRREGLF